MRIGKMTSALMVAGFLVALVTGCGGGGGSNPPPTNNFVVTGTVRVYGTQTPVVDAVVTISGQSDTTGSDGTFSIGFAQRPVVSTYAVALSSATPQVYSTPVYANGSNQVATSITFPLLPATGGSLGVILAYDYSLPPPPPM